MSNTGSDKIDSSIDEKVDESSDSPINASVEEVNTDENAHSTDSESINQTHDFGKILSQARINQNYSITEVNEQIKVPHHVLLAIEASDIATLPAPTFTQGYIHSYAKFLEISEESVLALYRQAINGNSLSSLKPRSTLSKKSSNQFPLVKIAMALFVVISVLILIYNSLQSDDTSDFVEAELASAEDSFTDEAGDTGNVQKIEIKQQARLNEEGALVLDNNDLNNQQTAVVSNGAVTNNDTIDKETGLEKESEADAGVSGAGVNKASEMDVREAATEADASEIVVTDEDKSDVGVTDTTDVDSSTVEGDTIVSTESTTAIESAENTSQSEQLDIDLSDIVPDTEIIDPGNDTISFFAELEAWVDVRDANDTQLYYNMLPEGGSRMFTGLAPFSVTIGNARTIIVEVNEIEVNLSRRIRSTNTATFTVSTNKKRVIFH